MRHFMSQPLKMVIFGTFLTTHFSELRNASVNPISPAVRVKLKLFADEKKFNPQLPEVALMRHFMSQPLKMVIFGISLNTHISKVRKASTNSTSYACRMTLEQTWERKNFNPWLQKKSVFDH